MVGWTNTAKPLKLAVFRKSQNLSIAILLYSICEPVQHKKKVFLFSFYHFPLTKIWSGYFSCSLLGRSTWFTRCRRWINGDKTSQTLDYCYFEVWKCAVLQRRMELSQCRLNVVYSQDLGACIKKRQTVKFLLNSVWREDMQDGWLVIVTPF